MVRAVIAISVLGFVACGEVVEKQPDAMVCPGTEASCDPDGCVDLQTDERHCGDCTTSCTSAQACLAGNCVDATESCARIKALDPAAMDGPYTHAASGRAFYCDMTRGIQYDELAMGRYNMTYPGYQLAGATELADPVAQRAFVFLFNAQGGGMITLAPPWMLSNCCFASTAAGSEWIQFGGTYLFVAKFGAAQQACTETFADAKYSYQYSGGGFAPVPLPADYFTTHPVGKNTECANGDNPAFFFKRTP